jgi:hypothetical protein
MGTRSLVLRMALLFFFLGKLTANSLGQNAISSYGKIVDTYYIYENGCDTGGQQDWNYCLAKAADTLSAILYKKYTCIVSYLEGEIEQNSHSIKDTAILSMYKKEKKSVLESQATWEKLLNENFNYYKGDGGTMENMDLALSLIEDDKDRLRRLDRIITELGEGFDHMQCDKTK